MRVNPTKPRSVRHCFQTHDHRPRLDFWCGTLSAGRRQIVGSCFCSGIGAKGGEPYVATIKVVAVFSQILARSVPGQNTFYFRCLRHNLQACEHGGRQRGWGIFRMAKINVGGVFDYGLRTSLSSSCHCPLDRIADAFSSDGVSRFAIMRSHASNCKMVSIGTLPITR